ncbi:MAG: protein rep [Wenzhouxiangella sp.]|nr:protein rep [Wenzhouxiangella sp.]
MAACCCSPLVQRAPDGQIRICPIRCRDRLCPLCCLRRAREVALRFAAAVGAMDAARHLVLTAPAVDAPLAEQLAELRAGMKRLRQSAAWKAHVRGGCYTIEITRNRKTGLWHPHVHVIMDGAFFPHAEARAAWAAALGGSPLWPDLATTGRVIVHLSAVHHRSRLATYIAKYIAKPAELGRWTAAAICEYARALKGVRMLHTFGSLHGVKLAPPDPNPDRAGSETLIGLGELDWRARQGWPEAERAVALIRRLQPKLGRWIGTPTRDADAEWADGVDDPNGMLGMLCGQVRRISSMQGPAPPQIRRPRRGAGRSGEQGGGPLLWPAAVS